MSERESEADEPRASYGVGRLLTLIDGVFAISMTLLALDVRIPDAPADTAAYFRHELGPFLGKLGVFVAAFVITSRFWLVSHRQMATLRAVDAGVLQRAVLFLAGITTIPVATGVLFRFGDVPGAVTFAALVLAVTSALSGRLWWYVSSPARGLADVGGDDRRRGALRMLLVVVVYLLAIPLAYAVPRGAVGYTPFVWLLLAAVDPATDWVDARFGPRGV